MTVSSGFFNSVNHDRLYDAEQLSSIFDGIIIDGVYENIGDAFMVTAYPDADDTVIVGTGRAWFDHTWTLNDSQFSLKLDPPSELVGRIDAIVIDVDKSQTVRKNSILYVKGSESTPNDPPALINTETHKQYPICYIDRGATLSAPVQQSQIENLVGTGHCPIVTGILEAQNLENLWAQLDSEFNTWWDGIKDVLDENVVTNLQNQINDLKDKVDGENALMGLIEKKVYDKFITGDYGITCQSYSLSSIPNGIYEDYSQNFAFAVDAREGIFLLPDSWIARILMVQYDDAADYSIAVLFANTSGVVTFKKTEKINLDRFNNHGCFIIDISADSYPVTVKLGVLGFKKLGIINLNISSQHNISFTESTTTITANNSFSNITSCNHAAKLSNGNSIAIQVGSSNFYSGDNDYQLVGYITYSITKEGVVSFKETFSNPTKYTEIDESTSSASAWLPPVNVNANPLAGDLWVDPSDNNVYFDTYNMYYSGYGMINPITLETTFTALSEDGINPNVFKARLGYFDLYHGAEMYSGNEKSGLLKKTWEDTSESTSSKISNYYLGASNSTVGLPEGNFILGSIDAGLVGIDGSGNQMLIGSNGGTALLKAKKKSVSLAESNLHLWLYGYRDTDEYTAYLTVTQKATSGTYQPFESRTNELHNTYHLFPYRAKSYTTTASVVKLIKS